MEPRLHQRLQDHLDDRLRHAVGNGRNAERPRAAVVLRYLDEPHGRRMIRARRHPIPDLVQVTLQVLLEPRQGHPIHARSTAVRLHPLVRLPDELLGNVIRLCLRHRLLPSRVGQSLWRECRVPSLRPHYQASSLLRTRPSLRPASVLGSSRFRRLEVSLGIEAPGSHVPHKSLSLVSRRLHAGRRSASQQAPSELHPRPTTGAWFWRRPYAFDTSSTVQSHSSYQRTADGFPRLFRNAHHPGHCAGAACGGLDPDPAIRARGAGPHLLCSKAASSLAVLHQSLLSAPSWRTIVGVVYCHDVPDFVLSRPSVRNEAI